MKHHDANQENAPTSQWWIWLAVWVILYFGFMIYNQIGWFYRQTVEPEQQGLFTLSSFKWHTVIVFSGSMIPATAILATDHFIPDILVRKLAVRSVDLFWYPFGLVVAVMTILATQDQQLYARYEQSSKALMEVSNKAEVALSRSISACNEREKYPLLFRNGGYVIGTKAQHYSASEYCSVIVKGDFNRIWASRVHLSIKINNLPPAPVEVDRAEFYRSLMDICPSAVGVRLNEQGRYVSNADEPIITGFVNANLMLLRPTEAELGRLRAISQDLLEICKAVIDNENHRKNVDWYADKYSNGGKPLHPWFWVQILALLAGFKVSKSIAELAQTWREGKR